MNLNEEYRLIVSKQRYFLNNRKSEKYFEIDERSYKVLQACRDNVVVKNKDENQELIQYFKEKKIILEDGDVLDKIKQKKKFNMTQITIFHLELNSIFDRYPQLVTFFVNDRLKGLKKKLLFISIVIAIGAFALIAVYSDKIVWDYINGYDFSTSLLIYFSLSAITIIHELGHTLKCKKYAGYVGRSGCKLFFLFPVLYTDVTIMTALGKQERLKIISAGIINQTYVEGILGLYIIIDYLATGEFKILILNLLILNCVVLLTNLNPLFKYDGYWMVSTVLGAKNLYKKSITELLKVFDKNKQINKIMALYGVGLITFFLISWSITFMILYSILISILQFYLVVVILIFLAVLILKDIVADLIVKNA